MKPILIIKAPMHISKEQRASIFEYASKAIQEEYHVLVVGGNNIEKFEFEILTLEK